MRLLYPKTHGCGTVALFLLATQGDANFLEFCNRRRRRLPAAFETMPVPPIRDVGREIAFDCFISNTKIATMLCFISLRKRRWTAPSEKTRSSDD